MDQITPREVQDAAAFMQRYLMDKIPDGDFTQGSPLYDHVILGFAYLFAYLSKQNQANRSRQSLLTLQDLPADESVDDAATAILSNLLVTRTAGRYARGPAVARISERSDVLIQPNVRFFRTPTTAYVLDSTSPLLIAGQSLLPVYNNDGSIREWRTPPFQLVAVRVGTESNVEAGTFVSFNRFSPFCIGVENISDFQGGLDPQATRDYIGTAGTAVSIRALLNARSNSVLLSQLFPGIQQALTIGAGDPEMQRDSVVDAAPGLSMHVGGCTDIYLRSPIRQKIERLAIGASSGLRPSPDGKVRTFVSSGTDFTTAGGIVDEAVVPGDVLFIRSGIPEAPFQFRIAQVSDGSVQVTERAPFSVATQDNPSPTEIQWSIGNNYPSFDNKVAAQTTTSAYTSALIGRSGSVVLSGGPVYRIRRVELINAPSSLDPYRDSQSGSVVFTRRVNRLSPAVPRPGDELPFCVETLGTAGQSGIAVTFLSVGWTGQSFDDRILEVTYDTLDAFDAVDSYVRDPLNRPSGSSILVRGMHPIYCYATIPYRPVQLNTADPASIVRASDTFNPEQLARGLERYIEDYWSASPLDQGRIATEARTAAGIDITVYGFTVFYDLIAPNGQVYRFATEDTITVFPDGVSTARLLNPAELGLPETSYYAGLRHQLLALGVSNRIIRYCCPSGSIAMLRRT